jgi:isopentenyl-diphosphate delta-isomerase
MSSSELVVLVDQEGKDLLSPDGTILTIEKLEAHRTGVLHRAVSVFILNEHGELLLQKRAFEKYHSPGKWTNTCCTHPKPGETPLVTANRRLQEEMGLKCQLKEAFTFSYRADVGQGLIENEFDHIFLGESNRDRDPDPDPSEVGEWKWVALSELSNDIQQNPDLYTVWFRLCFPAVIQYKSPTS